MFYLMQCVCHCVVEVSNINRHHTYIRVEKLKTEVINLKVDARRVCDPMHVFVYLYCIYMNVCVFMTNVCIYMNVCICVHVCMVYSTIHQELHGTTSVSH